MLLVVFFVGLLTIGYAEITHPPDNAYVRGTITITESSSKIHDLVKFIYNNILIGVDASYPWSVSWDTTKVSDGSYTLRTEGCKVREEIEPPVEGQGSSKESSSKSIVICTIIDTNSVTVDNTKPAVNITSPGDGSIISGTVLINANITEANLKAISVEVNGSQVATSLPYSWDTTTVSNGSYTITVKVTDKAGNIGSDSIMVKVNNDITPPIDPALSSTSHTVGDWSNNSKVVILVSGASDSGGLGVDGFDYAWDKNPSWTCTQSKEVEETWTGDTFTAISDGDWWFHLCTVDNAGNWSGTVHLGPFRIDTKPPGVPGGRSPINGKITNDTSPTLSWNAPTDPGGSGIKNYRIVISGPVSRDYYTSNTFYTPTLDAGTFTWKVYARDNAGNRSAWSAEWTFIIDIESPITDLISTPPNQDNNSTPLFRWRGRDNHTDPAELVYSTKLNGGSWSAWSSNTSITLNLDEGGHTLHVKARDEAGNEKIVTTYTWVIDLTPPTIIASATANGSPYIPGTWTNQNVTVNFTCEDPVSNGVSSGVANVTGPQIISTEGSGQSRTGICTDNAGNSSDVTISVSIDKTPPTVNCGASDAVWHSDDVSVSCTASDGLSGLVNAGDANFSLSTNVPGETETADAFTGSRTVLDKAGNSTTSGPIGPFKIDKRAPQLSYCDSPDGNWHADNVILNCTYTDGGSGPVSQVLSLATNVTDGNEDSNAIASTTSRACDAVGNCAPVPSPIAGNKVDRKGPEVSCESPDTDWHKENQSITCTATDKGSGVAGASIVTLKTNVSDGEETDNALTDTHTFQDNVGNKAAQVGPFAFKIDRKAPTIKGSRSPNPNAFGWNNTDVTVHFDCTDRGSGVDSLTPPTVLSDEGQGQSITGTCTDKVGNSSSMTIGEINIDKTKPIADVKVSPTPNAAGWNNTIPVTISFSGTDPGSSGIASCTPDQVLSEDTDGTAVSGTCTDKADNVSDPVMVTVRIDTIPPDVIGTPDQPPNANDWYNDDVVITWSGIDLGSGVDSCDPPVTVNSEGENQVIMGHCTDVAGNEGVGSVSLNIDKTAPTITGSQSPDPNAFGWNNTDVTVSFTCDDALSGIDSCVGGATLTAEGAGQSVTGTATDKAGNIATFTVGNINIDKTAPQIAINTPPEGSEYILNERVIADWSANDSVGIDSASGSVPDGGLINTGIVGDHIFIVTATDLAGNTTIVSHNYSVRYEKEPTGAEGSFLKDPQAVAGGGGQLGTTTLEGVYTVGEIISIRFQLTDANGNYVTDAHPSLSIVEVTIVNGKESYNALLEVWAFEYDPVAFEYFLDLDTSGLGVGIYDLWIAFGDGTQRRIRVVLEEGI